MGPSRTGGDRREFLAHLRNLVETLGDARLIVVGGAGSLLVDGTRLVDLPDFPELYRAEALIVAEALDYVRGLGDGVDRMFFSPAPMIAPGERTGSYKVGADSPVGDSVSAEDFAVALIEEIEKPAHRRKRFTVANWRPRSAASPRVPAARAGPARGCVPPRPRPPRGASCRAAAPGPTVRPSPAAP